MDHRDYVKIFFFLLFVTISGYKTTYIHPHKSMEPKKKVYHQDCCPRQNEEEEKKLNMTS